MKLRHFLNILIVFPWILFISNRIGAQQIVSALQTHYKKYPQEKIYAQTDKQVYSTGQTIWYKIYAIVYGTPATLSKIVHIQLIDTNGKIIIQNKLALVKGNAHGNIQLPDNLPGNIYQLRCFTAWMLNFDESLVFHKTLFIKNLSDTNRNQSEKKSVQKRYDIQFFPEGGDLIDKITASVAFKATDQFGLPVEVYGEIKDDEQTFVDSFRTYHGGMGKFSLYPLARHTYYAIVHLPNHLDKRISLPAIKSSGIGVKIIEQNQDAFVVQVIYHEIEPGQYHDIKLVAYQQSGKIATYPLGLFPGINRFNISKKDFTIGILRLTFFDSNNIPLAERIIFLHSKDELQLQLQKDTISFSPKTKSAFTFQIKGTDEKVSKPNLSVSVTDADRVLYDDSTENICSVLLLTSELKGKIYDPAFYFLSNADSVKNALDLVMLTNGWRHFEWKKILNDEPATLTYPIEDSLYIAGKIIGYKAGKKNESLIKLIIQQNDSIRFIGYISPDITGSFILKDYTVPGLSTIFFHEEKRNNKNRNYQVKFYDNPIDSLSARAGFDLTPFRMETSTINEFMKGTWSEEHDSYFLHKKGDLKLVTIRGYLPTPSELLAKKYVSDNFDQGYGHNIDLINNFYPNSISLFDFLKGKFSGLEIGGSEDNLTFSYHGSAKQELVKVQTSTNGENMRSGQGGVTTSEPYIYLNEVHSSVEGVRNIPLSDIALIRFIAPPATMAPFNGGVVGVLAIYLKKSEEAFKSLNIQNTFDHFIFHGYSVTRQFYSPDYSVQDSAFSLPDNRETLYWNPDLQTESDNKIHFSFYNSDHAKKFRIVAEGMDEQGKLFYINKIVNGN